MQCEKIVKTEAAPAAGGDPAASPPAAPAPVLLGPSGILVLAVWFGVLTGLGEVAVVLVRIYGFGGFVREFPHLVWMAPVADVLLMAAPGLLLALAAARWPRLGSLRLVAFGYLTVAFLCLL